MTIDKPAYSPGRFAAIFEHPFAHDIWNFLIEEDSISALEDATRLGRAAIQPLLHAIETRWAAELASPDFPPEDVGVMVNNMVKQIMEQRGYQHTGCVLCPGARFIGKSGAYGKLEPD